MNDDLDDLAHAAADALVSAMATDSWEAVKRRFVGLVGHARRMDATRIELAPKSGAARERAQLAQARDWSTRLRDVLDDDPAVAVGLRALLADLRAAPAASSTPMSQHARADQGSQAVNIGGNVSGNTGEVYVGVGRVDKRRFRIMLFPVTFFIRVARKVAAAHPVATATATVVVVGGVSAGVALAKEKSSTPLSSMVGTWAGSYTCAQGLTGISLQVAPVKDSTVSVLEDFYPVPANPAVPEGSVRFRGTLSGSTVRLTPISWVVHPAGYFLTPLAGALPSNNGSAFSGTVIGTGCTTFSVRRAPVNPPSSDAVGTWVGTYTCAQGLTGLRLVIQPATGDFLTATFNFYAVPTGPSVPSGSFTMTGFADPAGVFLNQDHWITQPPGYEMVNIAGSLPPAGGRTFSGSVVGCSSFSLTKTS